MQNLEKMGWFTQDYSTDFYLYRCLTTQYVSMENGREGESKITDTENQGNEFLEENDLRMKSGVPQYRHKFLRCFNEQ